MVSVLAFINRIRTLQELDELPALALYGSDPDSETNCVLAQALGCPVGASSDSGWEREGRWVMRFSDRLVARRIGIVTGLEWLADPPEVMLPDALVDLAVAQHYGLAECDGLGLLAGWWVPEQPQPVWLRKEGQLVWCTPTDALIPGHCGLPQAA